MAKIELPEGWDAATGNPLTSALEHRGPVRGAAFSPDGTRVVTASDDSTARVWDGATGKPLTSPLEHQGWVWSAAFSPDGTRVVTAVYYKTARVWDAAIGKPLTSPLEHQGQVASAAFVPTARASSPRAATRPHGCGTSSPIPEPSKNGPRSPSEARLSSRASRWCPARRPRLKSKPDE